LAVNTHKRKWTAKLRTKLQKRLEPLHPYHYTEKEYNELFSKYFDVNNVVDIEDDVIKINNDTRVLNKNDFKSKFVSVITQFFPSAIFFRMFALV